MGTRHRRFCPRVRARKSAKPRGQKRPEVAFSDGPMCQAHLPTLRRCGFVRCPTHGFVLKNLKSGAGWPFFDGIR